MKMAFWYGRIDLRGEVGKCKIPDYARDRKPDKYDASHYRFTVMVATTQREDATREEIEAEFISHLKGNYSAKDGWEVSVFRPNKIPNDVIENLHNFNKADDARSIPDSMARNGTNIFRVVLRMQRPFGGAPPAESTEAVKKTPEKQRRKQLQELPEEEFDFIYLAALNGAESVSLACENIFADSADEAKEIAMKKACERYPQDQGWSIKVSTSDLIAIDGKLVT